MTQFMTQSKSKIKKDLRINVSPLFSTLSSVGTKFLHSNELWDDLRRIYEVFRVLERG